MRLMDSKFRFGMLKDSYKDSENQWTNVDRLSGFFSISASPNTKTWWDETEMGSSGISLPPHQWNGRADMAEAQLVRPPLGSGVRQPTAMTVNLMEKRLLRSQHWNVLLQIVGSRLNDMLRTPVSLVTRTSEKLRNSIEVWDDDPELR